MKSALLCRFGGIGDCLILTVVASVLKKKGYEVDYVVGNPTFNVSELFDNLDCFRNVFPAKRIMNIPDEFIQDTHNNWVSSNIIKSDYDLPIDYKHSIENNSVYSSLARIKSEWRWFDHQNSNFQNWVDLSLAWAKIDPTTIPDEDKIPKYKIRHDELAWAKGVIPEGTKIFGVQPQASSLVRTWYKADELPQQLINEYEGCVVLFFRGDKWYIRKGTRVKPLNFPENMNKVRASVALISLFDMFIASDSGMAHLAEIVGTKSIVMYLTVPSWTRSKYYKNTYAIEPKKDVWCYPCFDLNRYCWRVVNEGDKQLTDREKKILKAKEAQANILETAKELGTNPEGVQRELDALNRKIEGLRCRQPYCSASITNEEIMGEIENVLRI